MSVNESISDRLEDKLKSAVINAMLSIVMACVRPIATLTEVFFRKDMGERYFTAWNVFVGWVLLAGIGVLQRFLLAPGRYDYYGRFYPKDEWGATEWAPYIALGVWALLFTLLANEQRHAVIRRYNKGIRWHSGNCGIRRLPLPYVIEKGIPFVVGIALALALRLYMLGGLMVLSGIVSIALRYYEALKFRERLLDIIDGQIEQENLAKVVKDRLKPEQTEGLQAPLPAYVSDEFREQFVQAIGK